MAFTRISDNSAREDLGGGKKRTKYYDRPMWLNDNGSWVGKKRNDLTDQDHRIDLPGGHWIESKRSLARFLIGKNTDTRFNLDVKMETPTGGNANYSLTSESRVVTRETTDEIDIEWAYSHKQGPTTYPSVFKTSLNTGNLQFQFTAPTADTYRLFLQVNPVIGGVVSSRFLVNKYGYIHGVEWLLDTDERMYFTFPKMAKVGLGPIYSTTINEADTNLTGNTLFLYSQDYILNATEGFTLG